MMDGTMEGMGAMMAWMMGLGALGWVLVIGLLVAILAVLIRLLTEHRSGGADRHPPPTNRPHSP